MSSIVKEAYDKQEKICYLYNRYFVVTDNKDIDSIKLKAATNIVTIRSLMKRIAEVYKESDGKQLYVAEIPVLGARLTIIDKEQGPAQKFSIDTTRDIDIKEVNEQYLTFIANHSIIKKPELEFVINFIKDHREIK